MTPPPVSQPQSRLAMPGRASTGRIGLLDYGSGNQASVRQALIAVAGEVIDVQSPRQLDDVSHLVLPGVGSFGRAMRQLESLGLIDALRHQLCDLGKPFLGICVGMQILATRGNEFEECAGLNLVPGEVRLIPAAEAGLRLPHIGWNELRMEQASPLFEGLTDHPCFYFVHSYQLEAADPVAVTATCRYGSDIPAAVQRDNILGVQFHPEKSQQAGLRLLRNFCAWNP